MDAHGQLAHVGAHAHARDQTDHDLRPHDRHEVAQMVNFYHEGINVGLVLLDYDYEHDAHAHAQIRTMVEVVEREGVDVFVREAELEQDQL